MTTVPNEPSTEMPLGQGFGSGVGLTSGDQFKQMTIVSLTIGTVGVLGNILVLMVIFHYTDMRRQLTNMFIINQSVADTAVSFLIIGKYVYNYITAFSFAAFGSEIVCRLWASEVFLWGVFTTSTYNLVAVAIERYMKVVHPIAHRNHFTKNKALVTIVAVWVGGIGYTVLTTVLTTSMSYGFCMVWSIWPSEAWKTATGLINVAVHFFIPISIMAFCYTWMIIVIRQRNKKVGQVVPVDAKKATDAKTEHLSRAQKNLIKTLLLVTVCFVGCWSLNEFWFLAYNLGFRASGWQTPTVYQSLVVIVFLNSCINPFIYLFKYQEFQKGLKKLLRFRNHGNASVGTSGSGSASQDKPSKRDG